MECYNKREAVFNIEIRKMEIINCNIIIRKNFHRNNDRDIKSRESANNEKNNNNRNFNKLSKFIISHNNKNLWAFFI